MSCSPTQEDEHAAVNSPLGQDIEVDVSAVLHVSIEILFSVAYSQGEGVRLVSITN